MEEWSDQYKCGSCHTIMKPRREEAPDSTPYFGLTILLLIGGILIAIGANNPDLKAVCWVLGFSFASVGLRFILRGWFQKPVINSYCTNCNEANKIKPLTKCKDCQGTGQAQTLLSNSSGVMVSNCPRCLGAGLREF